MASSRLRRLRTGARAIANRHHEYDEADDPEFVPLKIAAVFSPPAEGNKDVQQIQEDLPLEKEDNRRDPEGKKAALEAIIADYNRVSARVAGPRPGKLGSQLPSEEGGQEGAQQPQEGGAPFSTLGTRRREAG